MHVRWKTLVFDFDSTLINCEGLDTLAELALSGRDDKAEVLQRIKEITDMGMNGEIPLEEGFSRRLALMSVTRDHVTTLAQTFAGRIMPSVLAHKDFFATNRDSIYIVSGGFVDFVNPVADVLGIDRKHVFANEFIYDEQGVVQNVADRPTAKKFGKAVTVAALKAEHPIIIVGDGYTDYEVKAQGAADTFIAFTECARREKVLAVADAEVSHFGALLTCIR
jgi:D-3-phosphoglycerate dehydrogenase